MNWPHIGYRAGVASRLPRRLFQLVEAMQGSKRHTTATLAAQLGVSERTVRRDLGRLQDLDLPVDSRPGRNGGVTLPSGALLPSLRFTDDELLALVLSLRQAMTGEDTQLQHAATTALQRLETVLSPVTRDRIRALQRALSPGRRSDKAPVPVPSQHVFALAEAIDQQRRIEISYRSAGEFPLGNGSDTDGPAPAKPAITLRQVDPYGLARVGPWYLVAYCHLRQDLRTFRVDRIRNVSSTLETFVRPVAFDAYRHVTESIAMAPGQGNLICRVLLDSDMETASRLTPLTTVVLEPVDAGVRLSVKLDADEMFWFASLLLRLPCPVRIEGPVELVAAAAKLAERANRLVSRSIEPAA
ncbi:MAG TPA: WYL domain-containing protein [Trueperaceae bacterium]|nr:WYL domain-containing protein [Trueperaceae bacterium]